VDERVGSGRVFRCIPMMQDAARWCMRLKQEKDQIERRVGNYAREYNLTPAQRDRCETGFSGKRKKEPRRP
jgi:hypothetical protein